jgi:methanogenic corrinoid protein MtbC1
MNQLDLLERQPAHAAPHLVSVNSEQDLQLRRVVELEIIPRLMLMHGAHPPSAGPVAIKLELTTEHVDTLAHLVVEGEAGVASSYVQALIDAGASSEQIYLELLAPCARLLGQMWEEDSYDFSQVTIGLWRLQQVLYEQSRRFAAAAACAEGPCHRALLAAVPGSQHTFGVSMVAEFFVRAGWDVQCEPQASWRDLQKVAQSQWIDMIGLSIGTVESLPEVASAILTTRRVSMNPRVFVLVGGPMAAARADLSECCGADAMASEATAAVDMANRWVGEQRKQA